MELHRIAEDLREHDWYRDVVSRTVAEAEALAGRWAAFEDYLAAGDASARPEPQ